MSLIYNIMMKDRNEIVNEKSKQCFKFISL